MKLYTKLLTIAAAIALLTSTTSCTPEEAALGGALIGAGAAVAIMHDSHSYGHGGYYRRGGYRHYGHGGYCY